MTGRRTQPLPRDWPAVRLHILRRDSYRCYVCGRLGANEVDHVVPAHLGGTDDEGNLAAIHARPCHSTKTGREARAARTERTRARDLEPHPGLLT